jgi:hypothetical protein
MKKHIPFDGSVAFEYKGFQYCPEKDFEPDVVKIFHTVKTPEGKEIAMKMSPYETPTEEIFQKWIDLGMPEAERGNLINREIEKMWEARNGKK